MKALHRDAGSPRYKFTREALYRDWPAAHTALLGRRKGQGPKPFGETIESCRLRLPAPAVRPGTTHMSCYLNAQPPLSSSGGHHHANVACRVSVGGDISRSPHFVTGWNGPHTLLLRDE
jgi:hypothetical protein